jgi:hypothetical protein
VLNLIAFVILYICNLRDVFWGERGGGEWKCNGPLSLFLLSQPLGSVRRCMSVNAYGSLSRG